MKKKLGVGDLKKIELDLLNVLDEFCKIHGFIYFLTYGTLIGALRHKGFIPWDDDIDVLMPRADYDTFISCFNQENADPSVALIAHTIDKNYYLPLAKLVNTTTVLKENVSVEYEMGVYLDIFPLENLGDSLAQARARMRRGFRYDKELILKIVKWRRDRSLLKNLILVGGKIALAGKSISRIVEEIEDYCCETKADSFTKFVGVIAGVSNGDDSRIFEKEWFEETRMVEFEGKLYPAPAGADALLRKLYGDYMQLPSEDQRVSHHSFEAWTKE